MQTLSLLLAVLAVAVSAFAPLKVTENPIEGQYIVMFHESAALEHKLSTIAKLGDAVIAKWKIIPAFSAHLTPAMLEEVRRNPAVKFVEQDGVVTIAQSCNQQSGATWGIDRVSTRDLFLDGNYEYETTAGAGVNNYVLDTGIRITHTEFGARGVWGANFVDSNNADCNGHGTHVAGTIGGTVYGVAKKTTLIAVKVLDCNGSGSWTGVISGIDWVADQFQSTGIPSTINMSLGGGLNTAVNNAVEACVAAGVIVVVAAGNNDMNACSFSPASAPSAISVAATGTDSASGQKDTRAYFSNYGPCVDVLAPGLLITSAWITSNTAVNTISGTSMASPHVCGVVAMYLATHQDRDPDTVKAWIASSATSGIVELECGASETVCQGTVNLLLHNQCA